MTDIQKMKVLLDYNNYLKECVSKSSPIDKNTIREYLKGSYWHQPIKTK